MGLVAAESTGTQVGPSWFGPATKVGTHVAMGATSEGAKVDTRPQQNTIMKAYCKDLCTDDTQKGAASITKDPISKFTIKV